MTEPHMSQAKIDLGWHHVWNQAQDWQRRSDTQSGWNYAPGSYLALDDKLSRPLQVSHAVQALLHAAVDHQHAIGSLVMKAEALHTYAGATLVRGAIEAASTCIWILEPRDRKERVLRALRWNFTDLMDRYKFEQEFAGVVRPAKNLVGEIVEPVAARANIKSGDAMTRVTSTAVVAAADRYLSSRGEPLLPLLHWRLTSGFAHGRRWSTMAFAEREERDSDVDPDSINVRFSMGVDRLLGLTMASASVIEQAIELYALRAKRARPPVTKKR